MDKKLKLSLSGKTKKPLKDIDVNKGFKTTGHKCASPNPKLPAGARVEGPIGP